MNDIKIIAHRGASFLAKHENSVEAIQLAMDIGADMVEFDVRCTMDGELIIYHDSVFEDTPISWQQFDEIERVANAKGLDIPTFEEVVRICAGKIKMDIELKETGYERKVVKILDKMCDTSEYSIKSFYDNSVYKVKKLNSKIETGLLTGMKDIGVNHRIAEFFPDRRLKAAKCDFISPYYRYATKGFIDWMHRLGYKVYPWTVNSEIAMKILMYKGVDGIITDKPDAGLYVRNELMGKKSETKD